MLVAPKYRTPKIWETGAEQQFSPHYDGWGRNPKPSGPPTPRLGKKEGGGGEVKEGGMAT